MKVAVGRLTAAVLLAALAVFPLACGGGSGGNSSETKSPAMQLLSEASLKTVHSGYFEALFFLDNETAQEATQWRALGPFLRPQRGDIQTNARYEHAGTYEGATTETRGVLSLLGGSTLFRLDGRAYSLPRSLPQDSAQAASGCQRGLEETDFEALLQNVRRGAEPVAESTVIEGDLEPNAVLAALHRLMSPSACGELVQAAGASSRVLDGLETEVRRNFKKSEATFTIGKEHVLTGIKLAIWIETPPPRPEEIDGTLTVNLSRVNEIAAVRESPAARAIYGGSRQPTAGQLSRLEAWVGLVGAVLGALEGA